MKSKQKVWKEIYENLLISKKEEEKKKKSEVRK